MPQLALVTYQFFAPKYLASHIVNNPVRAHTLYSMVDGSQRAPGGSTALSGMMQAHWRTRQP